MNSHFRSTLIYKYFIKQKYEFEISVCPINVGMDQDVDLQKVSVVVQPTPSGNFSPKDLIPSSGEGVVIPKQTDSPNPTIQIELTKETPVNVVLITLLGENIF